jgi:hypothetical protein
MVLCFVAGYRRAPGLSSGQFLSSSIFGRCACGKRLFENGQSECLLTGQWACRNALNARWRDDPISVGSHLVFAVH